MKKLKIFAILLLAAFMLIPPINVRAYGGEVATFYFNCTKTSVELGEQLGSFDIENKTEGIDVEAFGSNTRWLRWSDGDSAWHGFGDQTPVADSKTTHYGLRIRVDAQENWTIQSNPSIKFNGDHYEEGNTRYEGDASGGYVIIDLGTPVDSDEPGGNDPEPINYTITYDLNGAKIYKGNFDTTQNVDDGYVLNLSSIDFKYITTPKLKDFDCYEIDGQKYSENQQYTVHKNITIKFLWKDTETDDYVIEGEDYEFKFKEKADKEFVFYVIRALHLSDEDMKNLYEVDDDELPEVKEQFESEKKLFIDATKDLGELLEVYIMELYNDTDKEDVHDGPFKFRIKLTDEMKKYNTFKMYFVSDELEIEEKPAIFKINGEYLEGELPHLSTYALIGSVEEEPKTGDHIALYMIMGLLSLGGLYVVKKRLA